MLIMELNEDNSEKVVYDYEDYPIYIKRAYLSLYPDYSALAHWHEDIELIYVLSGEMQYTVNGKTTTISETNGIFINSKQMHFGFSAKKQECDFICIRLHPMLLCANFAYESNYVSPIIGGSLSFIHLKREIPWQSEILDAVLKIYKIKDEKNAPLLVQSLFWHFWSVLFENVAAIKQGKIKNSDFSVLKNMLGFIHKNYQEKISLEEISKAGAVGNSKCCKLFSKYIGQTPNAYLTNYRLQKGLELLKTTDMTVSEIALLVGFCGGSYFAEIFKKKHKISPTKFRAKQ